MSSENIAIHIANISKSYSVYQRPQDRLMRALSRRFGILFPKMAGGSTGLPKEFQALADVSIDIPRGETVGIIGRNGSGKSTLLQIICGTLSPTTGDVQVKGRVAALLELGAGFNPEFTGRENVYLNAALLGLTRREIDERLEDIFSFADIGEFVDQPVKKYSSGMYVRLAFSVIAHVDADVLIIDEALAVGDAFFTQKCMRFLRSFMQKGTVLFVSHDTSAVISLCERVIWLDKGEVKAIGQARDVCDQYLAAYYQAQHENSGNSEIASRRDVTGMVPSEKVYEDQRGGFINASSLRNDLEIFEFREDAKQFGLAGAHVTAVTFANLTGDPLRWVVGGETVCLDIEIQSQVELLSPIVGFVVRDRLGQNLFGDNTYLTTSIEPVKCAQNSGLRARFCFDMPRLPVGDYSVSVAIADGTQEDHVVHQWLHDAVMFKSHSTSVASGLIGIPMRSVELRTPTMLM